MCGIVAAFGLDSPCLRPVFESLLSVDVVRGRDSTGVAFVDSENAMAVVKDTVFPLELMRFKKYHAALDRF